MRAAAPSEPPVSNRPEEPEPLVHSTVPQQPPAAEDAPGSNTVAEPAGWDAPALPPFRTPLPLTVGNVALPPAIDVSVQGEAKVGDSGATAYREVVAAQAAFSRGLDELSEQIAALARRNLDATARAAIDMLAVRTWADIIAVSTSFARTSYDQWLDSAAKVSEVSIKLAAETAKPFFGGFKIAGYAAR